MADERTAMYLLMSAFHLSPWLKLISGRRNVLASMIGSRSKIQPIETLITR
jgi:hypothetical protein